MISRSLPLRSSAPVLRPLRPLRSAMPLRAKIQPGALDGQRQMASDSKVPATQPGDDPDDVMFHSIHGLRSIELNRPKKLNSLDGSMVRKITPRLLEWEKSDMVSAVVMKGAGEKALCAGGDVAVLAQWNQSGPEGRARSKEYFGQEYQLDHLIATYSKPYVAFMDGITMGGGVGLSMNAPFRIATERTLFAMPETTIGFFPDVGASFFLPRLDGQLGKYFALTSERLKGVQAYYHGIATHYIHSSSLGDVEARLAELSIPDYATMQERCRIVNTTLGEFASGLPPNEPIQLSGSIRAAIDRCFAPESVMEILAALEGEASRTPAAKGEGTEFGVEPAWAQKTLDTIRGRSPVSLRVTLRMLQLGRKWNILQAFEREHQIAAHFMEHPDFVEGVSARLIRKPAETPRWQDASANDVTDEEVARFFTEPRGVPRMRLFKDAPNQQYATSPYEWIALPKEKEVMQLVERRPGLSRAKVVRHFVEQQRGKPGVGEVVEDVLARKTVAGESGLAWRH